MMGIRVLRALHNFCDLNGHFPDQARQVRIDRRSINLSSSQRLYRLNPREPLGDRGRVERGIVLAAKPQNCPGYPSQFVRDERAVRAAPLPCRPSIVPEAAAPWHFGPLQKSIPVRVEWHAPD